MQYAWIVHEDRETGVRLDGNCRDALRGCGFAPAMPLMDQESSSLDARVPGSRARVDAIFYRSRRPGRREKMV